MKSSLPQSSWRYIYGISLSLVILGFLAYGWSFLVNMWLDKSIQTRQSELQKVEDVITKIWGEKAFFSYKFSESLADSNTIKRSDQIQALVIVLKKIQANNLIGSNAIQLSDFTISPTELTLKGKVSNLILLYYSSKTNNYINLIDRFAELPFITNIAIKKYNKVGNFYEFSLNADINPNVILNPENIEQPTITNTWEQFTWEQFTWGQLILENTTDQWTGMSWETTTQE